LVTPPLIQLLLEAALCAFVSLVQGVAATLGMIFNRTHRDWHTTAVYEGLPQAKSDIQTRETTPAENTGHPTALMVSSMRSVRPSNHERVLTLLQHQQSAVRTKAQSQTTALSPLIPTTVGIQGRRQTLSRLAASIPRPSQNRSWIPSFVGMSGTTRV
jgi:hypothetical protein